MPFIPLAMALANFAPGIIKLLTGSDKAEDVAAHVVGIAQTVTGTADGDAALAALKADPAKVLEFQQTMSAQQADMEKAYLDDVANARAMQVAALGQEDLFSKRFVYYFATAWSLFSMAFFSAVTFFPPEGFGQRIADTILGVLVSTIITGIFHYLYGSTRGSQAKSELLARAGEKA
ncbi:hypothetical protein [Cupriavidus sp. UYPR2.512]|uniref:hypothetical protein n=1 Tax=Cupriavidus sp. UYPR2.512 TaxID=1080187 RepID=UPI0003A360E0|nr:hypothetical protein [Cupriavidus sp. UYPR2.512]UIF90870.1 hypothetical protein KAF44_32295 [Cupriavidus necator]